MSAARMLLCVCALLGVVARPAVAEVTDLDAFLKQLDTERATLRDMTAAFRQARYASLFGDTTLSGGTVKYRAPGDMLWEYLTPDHSFFRVTETDVQFYFPLLAQIEVYAAGEGGTMARFMASFSQDTEALRADYELTFHPAGTARAMMGTETVALPAAQGLRLVPRTDDLKAQFTHIDLWVQPNTFLPALLIIAEPSGDRTTFLFEDIAKNVGLDDAALEFHAPPGTEIVRVNAGT